MAYAVELNNEAESSVKNDSTSEEDPFLSMMAICGETVFNWLCLSDLASVNTSCKQLKQQSAEYFHEHYKRQLIDIRQENDALTFWPKLKSTYRFASQFRNVGVTPSPEVYNYMLEHHSSKLHSLSFSFGEIAKIDKEIIAGLTKNVKIIEVYHTTFDGELYEYLLKHCTQMEHLILNCSLKECTQRRTKDQWQLHTYPSLKHFYWRGINKPNNLELFFRLNPNIRTFHIEYYSMEIIDLLKTTGIHFDELHVDVSYWDNYITTVVVCKLNELEN